MADYEASNAVSTGLHPELLIVFCQAAQTRSFSKAALRLNMAQPVVTRKIRQLEESFGVRLFTRTNRGCELTPAGELLVPRASAILQELAQLHADVRGAKDDMSGAILIGLPPVAGSRVAPYLADAAAARWPRLRTTFVGERTLPLCERLLHGDLSLAVAYDPPPQSNLVITPLLRERLYLVGAPASPVSKLKSATIKDLVNLPLILPVRHENTVRTLLEDAFAELDKTLTPVYEVNDLSLLRSLALRGLGCLVLNVSSVAEDVAAGRLIAVPITTRGLSIELAVVTTVERSRLRMVKLMIDLIAEEVRQLVLAGQWPGKPHVIDAGSSR